MSPVIALVGRPNVGKSTLFNRLTRSRDALVADLPGLTRDRQYGRGIFDGKSFIVIDTGGITADIAISTDKESGIDSEMAAQSLQAVSEADVCVLLTDAKDGLTPTDSHIFSLLRSRNKNTVLAVNKVDGLDADQACAEFYQLGAPRLHGISATQGRGVKALLQDVLEGLDSDEEADGAGQSEEGSEEKSFDSPAAGIKIALIGRPNVGKSTLANRMLGEERVVVFDEPGTTRDSIHIPFQRRGRDYTLIDTAGVRRRGKTKQTVEKFSVIKSLQAVQDADVVVLVLDARAGGKEVTAPNRHSPDLENKRSGNPEVSKGETAERVTAGRGPMGVVEQDLHLLGYVLESGRALVIAFNKWDGMEVEAKDSVRNEVRRRLGFIDYVKMHFISARYGSGVGDLYKSIHNAYDSARRQLSTTHLTRILERAVAEHAPPIVGRHRIKLRYAHPGGNHPPTVVIHGKQTERLPGHYSRYLENYYRKALQLEGTPVRIELRSDTNPFIK